MGGRRCQFGAGGGVTIGFGDRWVYSSLACVTKERCHALMEPPEESQSGAELYYALVPTVGLKKAAQ